MKAKDLREKSLEDLRDLEKSVAKDVFQVRFKNFTNRLDDTSLIGKSRRDLARIRTLLHERASAAARSATPAAAKVEAPKGKAKVPAKAKAAPAADAPVKAKAAKSESKTESKSVKSAPKKSETK